MYFNKSIFEDTMWPDFVTIQNYAVYLKIKVVYESLQSFEIYLDTSYYFI